jgi:hypothetical protein
VFKQGTLQVSGAADFSTKIGNFYMKHQRLGYQLQASA